jgi:hypothetical protein
VLKNITEYCTHCPLSTLDQTSNIAQRFVCCRDGYFDEFDHCTNLISGKCAPQHLNVCFLFSTKTCLLDIEAVMLTSTGSISAYRDSSVVVLTYRLTFQEGRFALIHIPLQCYAFFLQPIQRLLFGEDHDEDAYKIPWPYRHSFLNVSITPVECSVVCSRELANRFFCPLVDRFNNLVKHGDGFDQVQISPDDFTVIQVDGQGLDAGQRVLELTSPLALAGM